MCVWVTVSPHTRGRGSGFIKETFKRKQIICVITLLHAKRWIINVPLSEMLSAVHERMYVCVPPYSSQYCRACDICGLTQTIQLIAVVYI